LPRQLREVLGSGLKTKEISGSSHAGINVRVTWKPPFILLKRNKEDFKRPVVVVEGKLNFRMFPDENIFEVPEEHVGWGGG